MNLTTTQEQARSQIVIHLGMPSGNAQDLVLGLDDAETAAIAAAASQFPGDAERARRDVRDLVSRANERRGADQGRAGLPIAAAVAARNFARGLLQLHCGLSADAAAAREAELSAEQRQELQELGLQRQYALAHCSPDPVSAATVRRIIGA